MHSSLTRCYLIPEIFSKGCFTDFSMHLFCSSLCKAYSALSTQWWDVTKYICSPNIAISCPFIHLLNHISGAVLHFSRRHICPTAFGTDTFQMTVCRALPDVFVLNVSDELRDCVFLCQLEKMKINRLLNDPLRFARKCNVTELKRAHERLLTQRTWWFYLYIIAVD